MTSRLTKNPPRRDSLSPKARAWLAALSAGWVFDPRETEVLRAAAEAWDRYHQAKAQIDKDGPTVADRFGQLRVHPAHVVERDSRAAFLQALRQLEFVESKPAELLRLPARRGRKSA